MPGITPDDESVLRRFVAWKHRSKDFQPGRDGDPAPQQVYADLMKSVFAPALRQAGLKGSNRRFELRSEKYWAQLWFQKSAYSDGQEVRFTVNLSVIDRALWDQEAATKPYLGKRPSPGTRYGRFQEGARLVQLVTGGDDLCWRIVRGTDAALVAEEVVNALVNHGVPWLVSRSSD